MHLFDRLNPVIRLFSAVLLLLGFIGAPLTSASASPTSEPSPSPTSEPSPSPTSEPAPTPAPAGATQPYMVIAKSGTSAQEVKAQAVALGVDVETLLQGLIEGVAADLTPLQRATLSVEPGVDYIERDLPVSTNAEKVNTSSTAIRTDVGCTANSLGNTDDASTRSVSLGFPVNWFGTAYSSIIINNNGGMTFDDGLGVFNSYNRVNLETTMRPLVLPLFTDLDTSSSSAVTHGPITVGGQSAYCINWVNVGEYPSSAARHSFQLILIDQGSGNIDIEFNYGSVSVPASTSNPTFVIGYADPNNRANSLVRVRNTDSPAPYANGGANALATNKYPASSTQAGRYTYQIRPTVPLPTPPTPPVDPTPGSANCTPSAQTPSTWGLDRIDQRSLPLSNSYACPDDGAGVRAYVVDTGIYANSDFSSRLVPGISYVSGSSSTVDCNGHGTHVAGTIGGTLYGVAKSVTLVPVRVLDCSGSGSTSSIVSGLNWIGSQYDNASDPLYRTPAVVNMSLGGGGSKSFDDAVAALVALGVTVVVAAGNDNADASNYSPAREPSAITVGATTSTDARSSFSNFGTVLDIFAPGSAILSTWNSGPTSTATLNGTSMAAPHVAGAVATYLGLPGNGLATPAQVEAALTFAATSNAVGNPGTGSPNLLLYARSYGVAPVINSLSPVSGSSSGGTTVTLTGSNLTGATGVSIRSIAATSVSVISDSQLTFVTPAGSSGAADVVVTTLGGTATSVNAFTYTAAPVVGGGGGGGSSDSGPASGGSSSGGGGSIGGGGAEPIAGEKPVANNQVSRPGEFKAVDISGAPLTLRKAELTGTGFSVAGADWELSGAGPLSSKSQTVAPGQQFTISGSGLQPSTTTGIYLLSTPTWVGAGTVGSNGSFTASFVMPNLSAGIHTLQINMVRQGALPVSIAVGLNLDGTGTPTDKSPLTTTNALASNRAQSGFADFAYFAKGSSTLSATAKKKLTNFASKAKSAGSTVSVKVFTSTGKYKVSPILAKQRSAAITKFLATQRVTASTGVSIGNTLVQSRAALIYAAPGSSSVGIAAASKAATVDSLIVRYKDQVKPTSKTPITGTDRVTTVKKTDLTLGTYLGFRMYQVDFATPVSLEVAKRVAGEISKSAKVDFAEVNGTVTIN